MKSTDSKTKCPVCNALLPIETLKLHIAQMARYEVKDKYENKKHLDYLKTNI